MDGFIRRICHLLGQVNVVITDSPILLSPIYDSEQRATLEALVAEEHLKMRTYNVFVKRTKPFVTKGRNITECEARAVDDRILDFLDKHHIPFEVVEGTSEGIHQVVRKIHLLLNKKYESK